MKTQRGKTREAIYRIETDILQDKEEGRSIHFIYTMNSILNSEQFAKRLNNTEEKYGKGSVVIFNSKDNKNIGYVHISSIDGLKGLCFDKTTIPRIVIMCSNHYKFDVCYEFIKTLNSNKSEIDRVSITFDELHEYISSVPFLRNKIEELNDMDKVYRMLALSATPEKIWTKEGFFSKIQILKIDDTTNENYIGYDQMNIFNTDDLYKANNNTKSVEYQKNVLEKYPSTILCENSRTFIPGTRECRTHFLIKDTIFELNKLAVVVVINGNVKSLYYYNDNNTLITENLCHYNTELSETISSLIIKYKLQHRPYVITGLICVEMGQTLTHKNTGSFTSAIFGHSKLSDDHTYQLAGRVTGIMKNWNTYCKTDVYAPSVFLNKWKLMENCIENMAKDEYNGKIVSLEEYRPMVVLNRQPEIKEEKKYRIYSSTEIAKDVVKNMLGHIFKDRKSTNVKGFYTTSFNKSAKVYSLEEAIKEYKNIVFGNTKGKEGSRRHYPCYKSKDDNTTLRYLVCISKEDEEKLIKIDEKYPIQQ